MGDEIDLLTGGPPRTAYTLGDPSNRVMTEVPVQPGTWPPDVVFHLRSGESAYHRFEKLGDPKSLKEATEEFYRALDESQQNSYPDYEVLAQSYLAACNLRRFEMLGGDSDLSDSIAHFRAALRIESPKRPLRWLVSNLANALHRLYRQRRDYGILEESIQTYRRALAPPPAPADRVKIWVNYCRGLVQCYDDLGDRNRLDEAHELLSLAQNSAAGAISVCVIVDLGNVKLRKYGWSGQVSYLDQSIELYDSALTSDVRIDYLVVRTNLGNALRARFERFGRIQDLNRAIEALEVAFSPTGEGEEVVRRRALSLGNALIDRSTRHSDFSTTSDLERAISLLRNIANTTSDLRSEKAQLLVTLSRALTLYAEEIGDHRNGYYAEAVEVLRLAESLTNSASIRRDISLGLGHALLALEGPAERAAGLHHLIEAFYSTAPDDPLHFSLFNEIGRDTSEHILGDVIPNSQFSSLQIWLNPRDAEHAHRLSSQAMYLQQYLRAMDTDDVRALLDREPPPFKRAKEVPEVGALVVRFDGETKAEVLISLLRWWASQHKRDITLKLLHAGSDSTETVLDIAGEAGTAGDSARVSRRRVG